MTTLQITGSYIENGYEITAAKIVREESVMKAEESYRVVYNGEKFDVYRDFAGLDVAHFGNDHKLAKELFDAIFDLMEVSGSHNLEDALIALEVI